MTGGLGFLVLLSFLAVVLDVGEEIPHLGFKCQLLVYGDSASVWLVSKCCTFSVGEIL